MEDCITSLDDKYACEQWDVLLGHGCMCWCCYDVNLRVVCSDPVVWPFFALLNAFYSVWTEFNALHVPSSLITFAYELFSAIWLKLGILANRKKKVHAQLELLIDFPLIYSLEVGSYVNTNEVFKEPNDVFKEPGSNKRFVYYFTLWLKNVFILSCCMQPSFLQL